MTYGVPYKGSKNAIVDFVVSNLPAGDTFVDLFAGGCAVTHAAMLSGKYRSFLANDINPFGPTLFRDSVDGKYAGVHRWVSRDDFEELKCTDPYVALCWSFGNNQEGYMYAMELEPWKRALHYAVYYQDLGPLRELGATDIVAKGATPWQRIISLKRQINRGHLRSYKEWVLRNIFDLQGDELQAAINAKQKDVDAEAERLREYLRGALKASGLKAADVDRHLGTNGMAGHYFGASQWLFPTPDAYAKMQEIMPALNKPYGECANFLKSLQRLKRLESLESLQSLKSLQSLQSLQSLERLQRLESLKSLESLESLEISAKDYREVDIPQGSIVYADIPYEGTTDYANTEGFDHPAFYEWCATRTFPVFVSSYQMPPEFLRFAVRGKRALLSGQGATKLMPEGLFIHRNLIKYL